MLRFALIGNPLGHSLSPSLHAAIADVAGFSCQYELCVLEPGQVRPFIGSLAASGYRGINVTIPYKLAALEAVESATAEARAIGAVNTVAIACGRTVGHNTDYYGFGAMLEAAGIAAAAKPVTVLGAGGAARAAIAWLADKGCEITVASRSSKPMPGAKTVAFQDITSGYLLVNCTPVGMHPHPEGCPVELDVLSRFEAVADMVYNPRETRLLAQARVLGLRQADGLTMLVAQAVRAQEIWQDIKLGKAVEQVVCQRLCAGREAADA